MNENNETRTRLIQAALKVFSQNSSASLSDVAERAGVKRITLHRLIGRREKLLEEVALYALEEMNNACIEAAMGETGAIAKLKAIIISLITMADRVRFLWGSPNVWLFPKVAAELEYHNRELCELIDAAKADGDINEDLPNAWIIEVLDALILAALQASENIEIDLESASVLAVETLFHGIVSSSSQTKTIQNGKKRKNGHC